MSELIPPQILHVDDDVEVLKDVREFLQGEDIDGWGRPDVVSLDSFEAALAELEAHRFDLMILDVRLGGHSETEIALEEEEGVRTLAQIKEVRFLPVIFWTGLPGKVEHLSGPLVHVLEKTAGLGVLLESVRTLFGTGLPKLNRALRRLVEDEQRRYMWDFVSDHWEELRADDDETALAYLLVRRLGRSLSGPGIQQLAAELGGGGTGAPQTGRIHAAEMYLIPPLAGTEPGAGDLFRETRDEAERWWLVVTPSCDLEHGKAEHVVLAACQPIAENPDVVAWWANDNNKNRGEVRGLVGHATGGQRDRYLFLPAALTLPNLVVDFQKLENVARAELDNMSRIASLVSPFAEAAVSRFIRYFGRVGTEDLDADLLLENLRALAPGHDL